MICSFFKDQVQYHLSEYVACIALWQLCQFRSTRSFLRPNSRSDV